jgi:hypothetical protein
MPTLIWEKVSKNTYLAKIDNLKIYKLLPSNTYIVEIRQQLIPDIETFNNLEELNNFLDIYLA